MWDRWRDRNYNIVEFNENKIDTMEYIDIYDAELNSKGTEERKKAHLLGLWHQTFHLWIVSKKGMEKFYTSIDQKKWLISRTPLMLVLLVIYSGESVSDGIREAEEELGIEFKNDEIHTLGYRVEVANQDNGQKNREYQKVHMTLLDKDLHDFKPQIEEVSGLLWIDIKDGMDLFTNKIDYLNCHGIIYDQKQNNWIDVNRKFTKSNFLPRIQQYYLTTHIMAERLIENRLPISIS